MARNLQRPYHIWKDQVTNSELPSMSKLGCLILLGYMNPNEDLVAWPSVSKIAKQMSCHPETTRKALKTAVSHNHLKISFQFFETDTGVGQKSNLYQAIIQNGVINAPPEKTVTSLYEHLTAFDGIIENPSLNKRIYPPTKVDPPPAESRDKYPNQDTNNYKSEYNSDTNKKLANGYTNLQLNSSKTRLANWKYPEILLDQLEASDQLDDVLVEAVTRASRANGRREQRSIHKNYAFELSKKILSK